ncbi:cytochrome c oxidase cbb3-type subunit 3 [Gillisia mitskevichiae]|uniref:Cytochrome c oxidase cbb3-type subunit 3 n=1 Tax=Gillisia mitskevichiae TaxID=270921 RepID=A0A495PST3_9FLAO|nr:cbb3-type cytochrome c oxidase N-terminal domain-containing protein [Gillisia mitskevichiae]RKS53683.1 cytochrome c oxidase cbb3-type subunit 3 [Gillisia mitskevichiae]
MKQVYSILRVVGLVALAIILAEISIENSDKNAFEAYPFLWLILGVVLLSAIAIEISVGALYSVLYKSLKPEAREQFDLLEQSKKEAKLEWWRKAYKKLLDKKPVENESEIILDHDYDGIRELDNNLPPWWLYGFYASIIFAFIYMFKYHVFGGTTQKEEYLIEVADAEREIAEYKKNAKGLLTINTVELLTEEVDLATGKSIFLSNCIACHKADGGGGIGPNLTDQYWILGGGIKNVFNTITEGGRPGKGMISWKSDLKPEEIAQVSSYVLSLNGTTPTDPKEPEGELYEAAIEAGEIETK